MEQCYVTLSFSCTRVWRRIRGQLYDDYTNNPTGTEDRAEQGMTVTETSGPCQFNNPWSTVPGGNPFPLPLFPPSNYVFPLSATDTFLPPKALPPKLKTWNFGVKNQFAKNWITTITYLGNEASHLMIGNEFNPAVYISGTCGSAPCSTTGNTQARRFSRAHQSRCGQISLFHPVHWSLAWAKPYTLIQFLRSNYDCRAPRILPGALKITF